jgi:hypothetical protein
MAIEKEIIIAIIGAVGVIATALLAFHRGKGLEKSQQSSVDIKSIIELSKEVRELHGNFIALQNKVDKMEDKIRVMWQYIYALIGQLNDNKISPIAPPAELDSDPVLMKLLKKIK